MGFEKLSKGKQPEQKKSTQQSPKGKGFSVYSASPKEAAKTIKDVDVENKGSSENKLLDLYNQYSQAANKARTFGLSGVLEKGLDTLYEKVTGKPSPAPKPKAPTTTGQKIATGIGEVVGSAIPIGGLYNVARQGVAKAIPTAVSLPAKIAKLSAPGAASVGAYEGIRATAEGEPIGDIAKKTAIGAAFGAGGELAGRAIGKGFGVLANKIKTKTPPIEPIVKTSLKDIEKANPLDSFRSKINREPKKANKFSEVIKKFQTEFVDDLNPLERLEKSVRGKVASAENSLYKTARLFRGVPTKAQEFIRSRLEPVIDSIEKRGYTYEDLGNYSLMIHARDVNARGINSGFTDDEIKAVINKFSSLEMENARKQLVKVSDDLLNDLAASGVIDASTPAVLRQKWPNYMPLFRHFDDDKIEFAKGMSSALANVTSPINKLVGSNRKVIDPIESMIKNIYQSINATERNKVAQQLGRLASEDTAGKFVRRLAPNEERGRLNTVYERVNGEKIYYEVDPEVYKAIMDLDKDSAGFLIKILQKPASLLRAGATLVPEFSFRNPIRDVVQAYVVSKSGFNPVVDFPVALFQIVFGGKKVPLTNYRLPDQLYRQWLTDSGGYGNIVSMDRNLHREVLEKVIKEGSGKKFVNILNGKSLIRLLRSIADTTESATKVGEYRAATVRSGVSQQEAAYRSRDIMDFSRAGTSIRQANRIVAFLNANIQGKSKILRAIREDPKGVTVRATKAVTMPSVGVYLSQKYLSSDKQKEIINDAPTWLKDAFWLLPIPGTDLVARIPKPFDLALFANIPERALRYIDGKDEKAFDEFAKETFSQLSIPVMLTGLAPFVEGMANYSFFRQGPIIPERERDLNYPDQYDINTSETAKSIAKGVNAVTGGEGALRNFGSPRIVENTIRGVTGGLGTYATNAVDVLLEGTGVIDKDKPTKKISEMPVVKAFLVNENISGKSMSDLYDERERLTRAKGSAKANKEPFKEGAKLNKIESVTKTIGLLTKKIRSVEGDKKLSSDEKRKQIDALVEKRNKLAKDTVSKLGI